MVLVGRGRRRPRNFLIRKTPGYVYFIIPGVRGTHCVVSIGGPRPRGRLFLGDVAPLHIGVIDADVGFEERLGIADENVIM